MENKFTPELIEKAKSAKTPEELMALAKENGMELTDEATVITGQVKYFPLKRSTQRRAS
jgi:hypothetical protein